MAMPRQLLIFPDTLELVPSKSISLTKFQILLELECGKIGYLSVTQRNLPSESLLAELAQTLQEGLVADAPLTQISDLIHDRHEISADILDSQFSDIAEWKVDHLVQASLASRISQFPLQEALELRAQLLSITRSRLREKLNRFIARLDPETLALFPQDQLRPSRYNYLLGRTPTQRRNRIQAAHCFPWLMPHVFWNHQLGYWPQRVCHAIDEGKPLLDLLTRQFNTSPSVIRTIALCPADILAVRLNGNIKQVAACLNAITPELRPKTRLEWECFGDACDVIVKCTGQNISTPQNMVWLAASARRGFSMKEIEPQHINALAQDLTNMSKALIEVLNIRLHDRQESHHVVWAEKNAQVMAIISRVVSSCLCQTEFSKLLVIVKKWRDAFRRHQADQAENCELIRGTTWPSPIPSYSNNSRTVIPLLSESDLIKEGEAMIHCVGSYANSCRTGDAQIWSIRTKDGKRCSTLETYFYRSRDGSMQAEITEHRGAFNTSPDPTTCQAADELLKAISTNTAVVRQFLEWRQTIAHLSAAERGKLITNLVLERSLQETLPGNLSLDAMERRIHKLLEASKTS